MTEGKRVCNYQMHEGGLYHVSLAVPLMSNSNRQALVWDNKQLFLWSAQATGVELDPKLPICATKVQTVNRTLSLLNSASLPWVEYTSACS